MVRAHIHIEASIEEFIRLKVPKPDYLPYLRYEAKVRLAVALGLREDSLEVLKMLGDIRNSFGHNLKTTLTSERVDALLTRIPAVHRDALLVAKVRRMDGEMEEVPFKELGPKDRFAYMMVSIKVMVIAEIVRAELGFTVVSSEIIPSS